ncbi:MAG: sterol desaturase family protein [Cohaesibacteraceae bacterium]|nr:sterol desaturase family protein [Cohaesibacteraceae bacterium]MBL4876364.1 sterol desaturase family protein [Cohaesibacteraceae bacterium]
MDMIELTQSQWRLLSFILIFTTMALLEALLPRRDRVASLPKRWSTNLGFVVINALVIQILVPVTTIWAAIWSSENLSGLLTFIDVPDWLEIFLAFVVLDFAIWFQHLMSHKIPWFWRLHRVHHADLDVDVTTGLRFHPGEILLSYGYKIAVIMVLGAPVLAVLIYEIILNGASLFNHANVKLPGWLDRFLRIFIVTPDMHRIHHTIVPRETDSNYGNSLSIWDRIFGTYTETPQNGQLGLTIGLKEYQHAGPSRLGWSLGFPFFRKAKVSVKTGQSENSEDKAP